mmetsp:Transcript_2276/g.5192  ORF Transcript_2276/g.5192 Transcript_2276/m.5192 type:complete len:1869 (+) Transcript_2276:182-5788(+)
MSCFQDQSIEAKCCREVARAELKTWKLAFEKLVNNVKLESKANMEKLYTISTNGKKVWLLVEDVAAHEVKVSNKDYALLMKGTALFLKTKKFYAEIGRRGTKHLQPILNGTLSDDAGVAFESMRALLFAVKYTIGPLSTESAKRRAIAPRKMARAAFFEQRGDDMLIDALVHIGKKANAAASLLKPDQKQPIESRYIFNATSLCLQVFAELMTKPEESTNLKSVIDLRGKLCKHIETVMELLRHIDEEIRISAAKVLSGMILLSKEKEVAQLQNEALVRGIALWILYICVNPQGTDIVHTKYFSEKSMTVFRNLFGLLHDGNVKMQKFVEKILPISLLSSSTYRVDGKKVKFLDPDPLSRDITKAYPFKFTDKRLQANIPPGTIRWQLYSTGRFKKTAIDWHEVMTNLDMKASAPRLIWNNNTKKTLLDSLLLEIHEFAEQKKVMAGEKWEYEGFEVLYDELKKEYEVGGYYLRLLLMSLEKKKPGGKPIVPESDVKHLMNKLFIKATVELKREEKIALVKTMSLIYDEHKSQFHNWNQVPYLVSLMQQNDIVMRDLVVEFLQKVLDDPSNVSGFVDNHGIQTLVGMLVAVHKEKQEEVKHTRKPSNVDNTEDSNKVKRTDFFARVAADLSAKTNTVEELAGEAVLLLKNIFNHKGSQYDKVIPRRYPQLINHLIQTMFAEDKKLVRNCEELLSQVLAKNARVIPTLAKSGLFIFVLQQLSSCSDVMMHLIHKCHMRQLKPYAPEKGSVLTPYLPGPLVMKLRDATDEKEFRSLLLKDTTDPSVIWGEEQRKELAGALEKFVTPLKVDLKMQPDTIFQYDEKRDTQPVFYKSLKEELCVGNIYLRLLFLEEMKDYKLSDSKMFALDLMAYMTVAAREMKDTEYSLKSVEDCKYVLKAQLLVVDKYKERIMTNYSAFKPLFEIMEARKAGPETQDLAGTLVISLLRMQETAASDKNQAGVITVKNNVKRCVEAGGTERLVMHFVTLVENKVEDILLLETLEALIILTQNATMEMSKVAVKTGLKFLTCIGRLMDVEKPDKKMDLCLTLLESLIDSNDFHIPQAMVDSGIILRIIQIAVEVKGEGKDDDVPKVAHESVDLIKKCISSRIGTPEEEKARAGVRTVVDKLLTPGIFLMLQHDQKGIDKVASHLRKETKTPTIIWTTPIRKELKEFFRKEEREISSYQQWDFDESFEYEELKSEPVWDHVYLKIYAEQKLGYKLPGYLGISTGEFFHSLLKMLMRFGREKDLLHDTEAAPGLAEPPKPERSVSAPLQIPFPEGADPLKHLTVLCRCVLHILKSDQSLHKNRDQGLNDLFKLIVHPYGPLQDAVLQVVKVCKAQSDSMQMVLNSTKWIVCMLHNSQRSPGKHEPSLMLVLDAIEAIVQSGAWPESMGNPPPGAKTFKEVETHLLDHGLPVMLGLVITGMGDFDKKERMRASAICGMLCNETGEAQTDTYRALHSMFTGQIGKFLPELEAHPSKMVEFFDKLHHNPEVYWTKEVRNEVINGIQGEAKELLKWQRKALESARNCGEEHEPCKWEAKTVGRRIKHPSLARQLRVGDFFVYELVNFPHYQLDPHIYLPPFWLKLEEQKKALAETGTAQTVKIVVALIESLGIVVNNLPHMAQEFEIENLISLYQMLENPQTDIRQNVLEVIHKVVNETWEPAAKERLVRYIVPLLADSPNEDVMLMAIQLLIELVRRSSPVVQQIAHLGGHAILILICFGKLKNCTKKVKCEAASLIGKMINDGTHGIYAAEEFCLILTDDFKTAFMMKPEALLNFFLEDHESKERKWNKKNRDQIIEVLEEQLPFMVDNMSTSKVGDRLFDDERVFEVWPRPEKEAKHEDIKKEMEDDKVDGNQNAPKLPEMNEEKV